MNYFSSNCMKRKTKFRIYTVDNSNNSPLTLYNFLILLLIRRLHYIQHQRNIHGMKHHRHFYCPYRHRLLILGRRVIITLRRFDISMRFIGPVCFIDTKVNKSMRPKRLHSRMIRRHTTSYHCICYRMGNTIRLMMYWV